MGDSSFDYQGMIQEALRDVVRMALEQVAASGLPGEHHFYIAFDTRVPGVRLPPWLHQQYPETMTVVLQHQFWDLVVDHEAFSVTLTFGGKRTSLTVPWIAVVGFNDPAVSFGLHFQSPLERDAEPEAVAEDAEPAEDEPQRDAEIISLDAFRRKS
ncbi:MAG: ClpXP protease specificity-enhancing factor SspB [Acidobacteriota bacterium]